MQYNYTCVNYSHVNAVCMLKLLFIVVLRILSKQNKPVNTVCSKIIVNKKIVMKMNLN